MPTVLRIDKFRFFFYSGDRNEPPHVHIENGDRVAKFWLEPVRLSRSGGYSRMEINRLQKLVVEFKQQLLEAWNEYFND